MDHGPSSGPKEAQIQCDANQAPVGPAHELLTAIPFSDFHTG